MNATTAKKAPARKAPVKKAPVKKAEAPTKAVMSTMRYTLGDKVYNPKAPHNIVAWQRITKLLDKGPATHEEIRKALSYTDDEMAKSKKEGQLPLKQQNHFDFIGYMLRPGYLKMIK